MRLFDIEQYELPDNEQVDWAQTKHNVGLFLSAYKSARERVGHSALPKLNMNYSLINPETALIIHSDQFESHGPHKDEFLTLNHLFVLGYSSIMHPYRPEVTERRRKVFMMRYVYGLPSTAVTERIHYQKNSIVEDSKQSMIQFSKPLSLLKVKEPTVSSCK